MVKERATNKSKPEFISDRQHIKKGIINARAECGGIQRTHFYLKIRCVTDPVKLKDISHAHT